MIVVVGANARKVGKTTLICAIIRAFPEFGWQALKITPHAHRQPSGDTGRFLAAGACSASLEMPALRAGNWIIESNRVLDVLTPDAYIFLQAAAPPDEKPRELWHLERATLVLEDWSPSDELPAEVKRLISSLSK